MTGRTIALGLAAVVALGGGAWALCCWGQGGTCPIGALLAPTSGGGATTPSPAAATPAAPVQFRYAVRGMHCGGCAEAIVAEVSEVPGVAEVRCTFESGTAEILAADADLRGRIEQAITKLGYRIEPLPDGAALPAPGAPDAHHADGAATGALSSR